MITLKLHRDHLPRANEIAEKCGCQIFSNADVLYHNPYTQSYVPSAILDVTVIAKQHGSLRLLAQAVKNTSNTALVYVFAESESFKKIDVDVDTINFKRCDRCNTKHNRKEVFFVESENKVLQVGGTCAQNLDCEKLTKSLINAIEKFKDAFNNDRELSIYGTTERAPWTENESFSIGDILLLAAGSISAEGFKSASRNPNYNTGTILYSLFNPLQEDREAVQLERDCLIASLPEEQRTPEFWINAVSEWLFEQERNSFIHNLEVVLYNPGPRIYWGLYAAAVNGYLKSEKKKAEAAAGAVYQKPVEGDKISYQAKITKAEWKEDFFGNNYRGFTIVDPTYGRLWFRTTAKWCDNLQVGDTIKASSLVKKVESNIAFVKAPTKVEVVA